MKQFIIFLIKLYQRHIRWALPRSCRFYPSCSQYFLEAVERHGIIVGSLKGIKRILRCNPLCSGGCDPVES